MSSPWVDPENEARESSLPRQVALREEYERRQRGTDWQFVYAAGHRQAEAWQHALGLEPDSLDEVLRKAIRAAVRPLAIREEVADASTLKSLHDLRAVVESVRQRVEELASELHSRPVVKTTTLVDLGDDSLTLRQPIQIIVQEYEGEVTACWPEVEAFASGDSDSEAILSLKRDIVAIYGDLRQTPKSELGALAYSWKRTLETVISVDGASEL